MSVFNYNERKEGINMMLGSLLAAITVRYLDILLSSWSIYLRRSYAHKIFSRIEGKKYKE